MGKGGEVKGEWEEYEKCKEGNMTGMQRKRNGDGEGGGGESCSLVCLQALYSTSNDWRQRFQ